jgi:hypothetical protein
MSLNRMLHRKIAIQDSEGMTYVWSGNDYA